MSTHGDNLPTQQMHSILELVSTMAAIRDKSAWGRNQSLQAVVQHLKTEIDELAQAVSMQDTVNCAEELGDVLMMAIFGQTLLEKEGNGDFDLAIRSTIRKLHQRYPELFRPNRQLLFPFFPEHPDHSSEERTWAHIKNRQKTLAFCFCPNEACPLFETPGVEMLELREDSTHRVHLFCNECEESANMSQGVLFYNKSSDRNCIAAAIANYIRTRNLSLSANENGISRWTLRRNLRSIFPMRRALARLLKGRFDLDEDETLQAIEDYHEPFG